MNEKKPKALVFFDLDGTLLNSDVDVAQSSVAAIEQLKANHILPILATGRTRCEVAHIMQKSGIDSIVGMNGQIVFYENDPIFINNIKKELIQKMVDFSKENEFTLSFYSDSIMRVSAHNQIAITNYAYLDQNVPPVDPDVYQHHDLQMLLLLCESGEEIYFEAFPELTFIRNTPFCVDVFNKGGSKAFGIEKLIEKKGLFGVPTYAFGDGLNDMEMFQFVDHPIAMGNARSELKAIAEFITDDHDHDGIANGLRHFGLI